MKIFTTSNIVESSTKLDTSKLGRAVINKLRSLVHKWGGEYAYFSYEFSTNPWKDSQGNALNTNIQFEDIPLYIGFPTGTAHQSGLYKKVNGAYVEATAAEVDEFNSAVASLVKDFFKSIYEEGYTMDNGFFIKYGAFVDIPLAVDENGLHSLIYTRSRVSLLEGHITLNTLVRSVNLELIKLKNLSEENVNVTMEYSLESATISYNKRFKSEVPVMMFAPDVNEENTAILKYLIPIHADFSTYRKVGNTNTPEVYAVALNGYIYPNAHCAVKDKFPNNIHVSEYIALEWLPVKLLKAVTMIQNEYVTTPIPYFEGWNRYCREEYRMSVHKDLIVPESILADLRLQEIMGGKSIATYRGIKFFPKDDSTVRNLQSLPERIVDKHFRVNSYDFTPVDGPKFYKHESDTESVPLYMGCEIELNRGGETNTNASTLLIALGNGKDVAYAMHDGSLNNGIEVATHPATLEAHKSSDIFDYDRFFNVARALGFTGYDEGSGSAGLHVHVNRNFFKNHKLALHFMSLFLHANWSELLKFTRRMHTNNYARNVIDVNTAPKSIESLYDLMEAINPNKTWDLHNNVGKYAAINIRKSQTLEFRIFRGTLNETAYIATLEFVDALCRWANDMCILVDSLSLSNTDLTKIAEEINTFSKATVSTLVDRAGKEALSRYTKNYKKYSTDKSDKEII